MGLVRAASSRGEGAAWVEKHIPVAGWRVRVEGR